MSETNPLPEYSSPPLIEVVCGVQFHAPKLTMGHLGAWWSTISDQFPDIQEHPPIINSSDDQEQQTILDHNIGSRLWFINKKQDQLIQLQKGKFFFNWRKISSGHEYPRYSFVIQNFETYLGDFIKFLPPSINNNFTEKQFELTYINHIPLPAENTLIDFSWKNGIDRFLPKYENIDLNITFGLPNQIGTLNIRARNAQRNKDRKLITLLELSARGFSNNRPEWFSVAHEWIVRGFSDLTPENIQKDSWGKRI